MMTTMLTRTIPAFTFIYFLASGLLLEEAGAAETHQISTSDSPLAWVYKGQSSTSTKPLLVDDLQPGDIVEIVVPQPGNHGFMTVNGDPTDSPNDAPELVQTCADQAPKQTAVLRERCPGPGKFGDSFAGTMQLEVLPSFKDPVSFWCTVHFQGMPGILKLKQ
jgi:hypothetical protein